MVIVVVVEDDAYVVGAVAVDAGVSDAPAAPVSPAHGDCEPLDHCNATSP